MEGLKSSDAETLRRIAAFEEAAGDEIGRYGWTWRDVKVWTATLNRLVIAGWLDVVFRTNSRTGYRLSEEGKAVAHGGSDSSEPQEGNLAFSPGDFLPEDIFDDIVGHAEIKKLLEAVVLAPRPVHVLLAGPPALAKSLFLWDLERAFGDHVCWVLGSASSRAGLQEVLLQRRPNLLLVDELDKMNAEDQGALLSAMEGGRVTRTKIGRMSDAVIECRVVATANTLKKLSPELVSRFAVRRIHAYTPEEFHQVVVGVLQRREGLHESAAMEIAHALEGRTQNVRDAIRVARLSSQLGMERAMALLLD